LEKETNIYAKEYDLLKLLLERDMDAETAMHMLNITRKELNKIISKLAEMEMLQYVDHNTIELTDAGVGYLTKKEKK
jgi:Mn-dependent DtxR family transcriptional regulator